MTARVRRGAIMLGLIGVLLGLTDNGIAAPTVAADPMPVVRMVVSLPAGLEVLRLTQLVPAARGAASDAIGIDLQEDDSPAARGCMTSPTERHRLRCLVVSSLDTERLEEQQYLLVIAARGGEEGDTIASLLIDLTLANKIITESIAVLNVDDPDIIEAGLADRAVLARGAREVVRRIEDARPYFDRMMRSETGQALREFGSGTLHVVSSVVPVDIAVDGRVMGTVSSTEGIDITGLSRGAHRIELDGELIRPIERLVDVGIGPQTVELSPELQNPPVYGWAYDTLVYGGAAVAVAGVVVAVFAPSSTENSCIVLGEKGHNCPRELRPLASVGIGIASAGAAWAAQGLLTRDETTFPYLQTAIGAALGVAVSVVLHLAFGPEPTTKATKVAED